MNSPSTTLSADEQQSLERSLASLSELNPQTLPDCTTYLKYRPYLETAIPLIAKIPHYGPMIAKVLTFLVSLADTVCPAPGANPASPGVAAAINTIRNNTQADLQLWDAHEKIADLPSGQAIHQAPITILKVIRGGVTYAHKTGGFQNGDSYAATFVAAAGHTPASVLFTGTHGNVTFN